MNRRVLLWLGVYAVTCSVSEERLWSWLDRQAPELESHLQACSACRSLAQQYRVGIGTIAAGSAPRQHRLPDKIGAYQIVGLLGEGAQGLVYEAKQQALGRPVALKVVKGGRFIDEQDVLLFQREIQTLARLKHPSIAAIYEAGRTEEGLHFFAMELARGVPLTAYVAREKLTQRQRLALFAKTCEAIHYAHQRGVIHRDLKPSHVLVDGDGLPKILDFGLARLTDPGDSSSTIITLIGKIQGTLPYMSPEQVRGRPDEIDVRTDVYTLGVILYELLTGQLPYEVSSLTPHRVIEVICGQLPRKPSTVDRTVRGDVETIILKALEKEPARRYQSALALTDDVDRYLTGQAILARPPSAMYQFRKLVARHKLPFVLAALIFVLTAAEAIVVSVLYADASAQARKATLISTVLQGTLAEPDPINAAGRPVDVYQMLEETAKRIVTDLKIHPEVEAAALTRIGNTYMSLGRYDKATPHLWRALYIRQRSLDRDHPDIAASEHNLGVLLFAQGDYAGAKRRFQEALSMRRRLLGSEHADIADTLNRLAMLLQAEGDYAAAEPLYQEALAMNRKLLEGEEEQAGFSGKTSQSLATTLNNLATLLVDEGDFDSAEELFGEALAMRRKLFGPEHTHVATTLDSLAKLHHARKEYDRAEQIYGKALAMRRKLLGDMHPSVATSLDHLGRLLEDKGSFDGAEERYRESLTLRRALLGDGHPATRSSIESLAALFRRQSRLDEAEPLCREILEARRRPLEMLDERGRVLPDGDSGLASALLTLALVYLEQGDADGAEPLLRECERISRGGLTATNWLRAEAIYARGRCLLMLDRDEEARPLLLESLALFSRDSSGSKERAEGALDLIVDSYRARASPGEPCSLVLVLEDFASSLEEDGEFESAAVLYRRALAMARAPRARADEPPVAHAQVEVAAILHRLGGVLEDLGEYDAAWRRYREAADLRRSLLGEDHAETAASVIRQAGVLRVLDRLDEAERLYAQVLAVRRASLPARDAAIASSLMLLALVRMEKDEAAGAETLLRECLQIRRVALPQDHWLTAHAESVLGGCLAALGRYQEAERLLLDGDAVMVKALGRDHDRTVDGLHRIIDLYDAWNKAELATVYRSKLARALGQSE